MSHALAQRGRALIAAALLLVPVAAVAQSAPPPPPVASTTIQPPPTAQAAADARLRALQAQLHITDAQMPQWNAFAQAMRDNATNTDTLFRERAKAVGSMTALDNMKSYAQIARSYADNTEALAQAFAPLYGVLNDEQKQTINTLFREEAAKNASAPAAKP
jgi:periplasmic protein CpxP/Spy